MIVSKLFQDGLTPTGLESRDEAKIASAVRAEREAAAKRVATKRAIRRALMAAGIEGVIVR